MLHLQLFGNNVGEEMKIRIGQINAICKPKLVLGVVMKTGVLQDLTLNFPLHVIAEHFVTSPVFCLTF